MDLAWAESLWFVAASGAASIVGLCISTWVAFQLRAIKKTMRSKVRLKEISEHLYSLLSKVNELASDESEAALNEARRHIMDVKTHLTQPIKYLSGQNKKDFDRLRGKIGDDCNTRESVLDRYTECRQVLIIIDAAVAEKYLE